MQIKCFEPIRAMYLHRLLILINLKVISEGEILQNKDMFSICHSTRKVILVIYSKGTAFFKIVRFIEEYWFWGDGFRIPNSDLAKIKAFSYFLANWSTQKKS